MNDMTEVTKEIFPDESYIEYMNREYAVAMELIEEQTIKIKELDELEKGLNIELDILLENYRKSTLSK